MDIDKIDKIGSEISVEASPPSDKLAKQEVKEKFRGDEIRAEEAKQAIHKAFLWFLRVAAFAFIALFIVRMIHFMLPQNWCWLSAEQTQSIDRFLFSGAIGGLVGNYLKQIFPNGKK